MRSVSSLIEELKKFPPDSICYAYEGEITGIVIVDKEDRELGYITTSESGEEEGETVIRRRQ